MATADVTKGEGVAALQVLQTISACAAAAPAFCEFAAVADLPEVGCIGQLQLYPANPAKTLSHLMAAMTGTLRSDSGVRTQLSQTSFRI